MLILAVLPCLRWLRFRPLPDFVFQSEKLRLSAVHEHVPLTQGQRQFLPEVIVGFFTCSLDRICAEQPFSALETTP